MTTNRRGYILIELLIYMLIFSTLSIFIFEIASIFLIKINNLKTGFTANSAILFAQDLITKDLKSTKVIKKLQNGFIANNGKLDICWILSKGILQRKTGKYDYTKNIWLIEKTSIAAMNIEKIEIEQIKNLFKITLDTKLNKNNFYVATRLS